MKTIEKMFANEVLVDRPQWLRDPYELRGLPSYSKNFYNGLRVFDCLQNEVFVGDTILYSSVQHHELSGEKRATFTPGFILAGSTDRFPFSKDSKIEFVHVCLLEVYLLEQERCDFEIINRHENITENMSSEPDEENCVYISSIMKVPGFEMQLHRKIFNASFSKWIEFRDYIGKISGEVL